MEFLVRRDDLHQCRIEEGDPPSIEAGQALLAVDSFGMTANNVTYAVMGDAMSYWNFFPAPDGWGKVPVWGFAEVADGGDTGLEDGSRIYGYLPPASHLVVEPDRVDERGFNDGAPHRRGLPSAYQGYRLVTTDPAYDANREDEQILFWPLFYTSWLIDDEISDQDFYGGRTIVVSSASSKTALIAAYLLAQRSGADGADFDLIGLTSSGNADFVKGLGVYDATVTYDEISGLPGGKTVYVDMSGDGAVRAAVHQRYGDDLAYDMVVGATHHDKVAAGAGDLPGPTPQMFFAPTRVTKRGEDWGSAELDKRVTASWKPFVEWATGWLKVEHGHGPEAIHDAYLEVIDGKVPADTGHVISLRG
jgi:Protein of unknown function (DUF2855)